MTFRLPGLGPVLEQEQDLLDGRGHVEGGDRQRRRPRVFEEVLDDVIEPLGLARHDLREALARVVGGAAGW